jgi:hypothetical protein
VVSTGLHMNIPENTMESEFRLKKRKSGGVKKLFF